MAAAKAAIAEVWASAAAPVNEPNEAKQNNHPWTSAP
jgi:hypothetical protein